MKTVITLSKSYTVGDKTFSTIELREPTYADVYMSGIGDPAEWQPVGGGNVGHIVYPDRVDQYCQRLITTPGYEYISRIGVQDALKLRTAVLDFFRASTVPGTPPTSSSFDVDSTPAASSE